MAQKSRPKRENVQRFSRDLIAIFTFKSDFQWKKWKISEYSLEKANFHHYTSDYSPMIVSFAFYIHIDYVDESKSQSATFEIPKCQNGTLECSLEELAVLNLIKANPTVKQQELVDTTGKSLRSIKRIMKSLQDKYYIRRENGKRYGKWELLM